MAIVGYARVSTTDQDLTIQQEALKQAGCTELFTEKVSGTSKKGRDQLQKCLEYLRKGDTLIVTRVDRLGRSVKDLQDIADHLKEKGVDLKATEQPIDTSTPAGKAFFDMLGVFAEFETNLRRERQLEGVAKAKAAGRYKGRAKTAQAKSGEVIKLYEEGAKPARIVELTGVSRASVYRIINQHKSGETA
jgi:DNA invertase Pin-like site-specific DNA recombinase